MLPSGLGAIFLIAVVNLILIVGIFVFAVRIWQGMHGGRTGSPPPDARGILEERFARDEIDADEFRARLAVLDREVT